MSLSWKGVKTLFGGSSSSSSGRGGSRESPGGKGGKGAQGTGADLGGGTSAGLTSGGKHFWMDDKKCKNCYECDSAFTLFNRRHHCRKCGKVFCSKCASNNIPSFNESHDGKQVNVRVCNYCYRLYLERPDSYGKGFRPINKRMSMSHRLTASAASDKAAGAGASASSSGARKSAKSQLLEEHRESHSSSFEKLREGREALQTANLVDKDGGDLGGSGSGSGLAGAGEGAGGHGAGVSGAMGVPHSHSPMDIKAAQRGSVNEVAVAGSYVDKSTMIHARAASYSEDACAHFGTPTSSSVDNHCGHGGAKAPGEAGAFSTPRNSHSHSTHSHSTDLVEGLSSGSSQRLDGRHSVRSTRSDSREWHQQQQQQLSSSSSKEQLNSSFDFKSFMNNPDQQDAEEPWAIPSLVLDLTADIGENSLQVSAAFPHLTAHTHTHTHTLSLSLSLCVCS